VSASIARRCGSSSNEGVATTAEYVLLAGVSLIVFLSLSAASSVFYASSRDDAMAIAAFRVASIVSSSTCEVVGSGETSASVAMDLPGLVCGMPYVVYPSPDGRSLVIDAGTGTISCQYSAPLPLRADGVRLAGFVASPPSGHAVEYDAVSRTVTLK